MYLTDRTALAYLGEICALDDEFRFRRFSGPDLVNMSITAHDPLRAKTNRNFIMPV